MKQKKKDVEQAKLDAIALEQKKDNNLLFMGVAGDVTYCYCFSALLYKRFRFTNKQKQIIEIKSKRNKSEKFNRRKNKMKLLTV